MFLSLQKLEIQDSNKESPLPAANYSFVVVFFSFPLL
jgi:hypothetical protein